MSITSVTEISLEQFLPIQKAKRSPVSSLANRISDLFKNKILPFFKRIVNVVVSPLRRRKVSVYKAPLRKEPNAVAKKAEVILPAANKVSPAKAEVLLSGSPAHELWHPVTPPASRTQTEERQVIPQKPIQQSPSHLPVVPVKGSVKTVIQDPVNPPPQLMQQIALAQPPISADSVVPPSQPVSQLPAQPIVVAQVIPFTITGEIKKLTDSIWGVAQKQETILKKFEKASWFSPPSQKDINDLYDLYKKVRDEGKSLAQQLSSHAQQHQDLPKLVKELNDLSHKAQLGMDELDPLVKKGVLLGGLGKLLSSKEAELKRGYDFIKECRQAIQSVLNLPNSQHKA